MITETKKCTVYGLSSTKDDRTRYIGQTTQAIKKRLEVHLADAKRKASHIYLYRWIRKTLKEGFKIKIHPIEENCVIDISEIQGSWFCFIAGKLSGINACESNSH